jgi:hypothetical protein
MAVEIGSAIGDEASLKSILQRPIRRFQAPRPDDPWTLLNERMDVVFESLSRELSQRIGNGARAQKLAARFVIDASVHGSNLTADDIDRTVLVSSEFRNIPN